MQYMNKKISPRTRAYQLMKINTNSTMNNFFSIKENFKAYLNKVESPYFHEKIISKITKNKQGISIITLHKIVSAKNELSLKSKPKLSTLAQPQKISALTNLKNYTEKITRLDPIEKKVNLISSHLACASLGQPGQGLGLRAKFRPFNIFITETPQEKKNRELKDLINFNKSIYNSIEPNISSYELGVSTLLKSFSSNFNLSTAMSKNIVYNFSNGEKIKLISNIENILHNFFYSMKSLISRPVFEITGKNIIIHLFFFFASNGKNFRRNKNNRRNYGRKNFRTSPRRILQNKFEMKKLNFKYKRFYERYTFFNKFDKLLKIIGQILSKFLSKRVEFDLIRIHYPLNESHILAKSIGILGNKIRRRFKYFVNNSFRSANIINPSSFKLKKKSTAKSFQIHNASSSITGMKMKLGGRLLSQKIVPRFTSQTFQEGSLTRRNANFVTSSRFTQKNKKGTYSITVSIGHRFF